jgi:hypothetical protein
MFKSGHGLGLGLEAAHKFGSIGVTGQNDWATFLVKYLKLDQSIIKLRIG